MSDPSLDKIEILTAIHRLEMSMVNRIIEQGTQLTGRIQDIERRHQLEFGEFKQEVWTRFDKFKEELHAKTDGQRATDTRTFLTMALSALLSIGVAAVGFFYGGGKFK